MLYPKRWQYSDDVHMPELQKVAVHVLLQVMSVAASQRNWSTFDFIHTKKQNRLHCGHRWHLFESETCRQAARCGISKDNVPWSCQPDDNSSNAEH